MRIAAGLVLVLVFSGCGAMQVLQPGEEFNTAIIIPNESLRTRAEAKEKQTKTWVDYLTAAIKAPLAAGMDAMSYGISAAGQAIQRALGVPEGLLQARMGRGTSVFAMAHVKSVTLKRGTKEKPGVELLVQFRPVCECKKCQDADDDEDGEGGGGGSP